MQFGRLHGIALLLLAMLLLLTQAWIAMGGHVISPPPNAPQQSQQKSFTDYIPGIAGVVCLALGGYTLISNRNHADDVPAHPIK
jgi:hypothetical protein